MDLEQLEAAMIMAKLEGHEQKIYVLQRLINLKTKPHLVNKNPATMSIVQFDAIKAALERSYWNLYEESARARRYSATTKV